VTYTITQFANDTTPALSDLDTNFNALSVLTPLPCTVAGVNTLTFTQNQADQAASIALQAYENGVQICGVAASTNTGATTARLGALSALNVYKDTVAGPVALTGGEIVAGNSLTLRYDSTLNTNAGGWHLISSMSSNGSTITPALVRATVGLQVGGTVGPTLTGLLSALATLTYTSIVPQSSQDQSFALAGLLTTDALALGLPLPVSTGLSYSGYISAAGTVTVRALNASASTITPGAITVAAKGVRTG